MSHSLVENAVYWLNSFPTTTNAPSNMSPAAVVIRRSHPNFKYKYLPFGSFVMAYCGTKNNMEHRSVSSIALKPSNEIGGYYFMLLFTGKRIHAYKWTEVPISKDVIDAAHALAIEEKQPKLVNKTPIFEWEIGVPISNEADDNTNNTTTYNNQIEEVEEEHVDDTPLYNEDNTRESVISEQQIEVQEDAAETMIDENVEMSDDFFDEDNSDKENSEIQRMFAENEIAIENELQELDEMIGLQSERERAIDNMISFKRIFTC